MKVIESESRINYRMFVGLKDIRNLYITTIHEKFKLHETNTVRKIYKIHFVFVSFFSDFNKIYFINYFYLKSY